MNVNKIKMTMTPQLGKTRRFLPQFLENVRTTIQSSANFTKAGYLRDEFWHHS